MSTAPRVIHIKRKRDEAPVDSLYIESGEPKQGKRRRTAVPIFFKRLDQPALSTPADPGPITATHAAGVGAGVGAGTGAGASAAVAAIPQTINGIPIVRATPPGEEVRDPLALRQNVSQTLQVAVERQAAANGDADGSSGPEQRQFRLTKAGRDDAMELDSNNNNNNNNNTTSNSNDTKDKDADFVYDIFVRSALDSENLPSGVSARLIIGEDDQEWLDHYFYESDEDKDHAASDDEDSNAEDWYGADYPEDEDEDFQDHHDDDEDSDEDRDEDDNEYVVDYDEGGKDPAHW